MTPPKTKSQNVGDICHLAISLLPNFSKLKLQSQLLFLVWRSRRGRVKKKEGVQDREWVYRGHARAKWGVIITRRHGQQKSRRRRWDRSQWRDLARQQLLFWPELATIHSSFCQSVGRANSQILSHWAALFESCLYKIQFNGIFRVGKTPEILQLTKMAKNRVFFNNPVFGHFWIFSLNKSKNHIKDQMMGQKIVTTCISNIRPKY